MHTPEASSSDTCEAPRMESAPKMAISRASRAISTPSGISAMSVLLAAVILPCMAVHSG